MALATALLQTLNDPSLSCTDKALARCHLARKLEEQGSYEAAKNALGDLWDQIQLTTEIEDVERTTSAEVLLCVGLLTGRLGSAQNVPAQESAKDLITRSQRLFESLRLPAKAAESQIELAHCYWRQGALDEARITLRNALHSLGDRNDELKALALLRSAIVEKTAFRHHDALRILESAGPLIPFTSHTLQGNYHNTLGGTLKYLATPQNPSFTDRAILEFTAASFHFQQAGHLRYLARVENNLGNLLITVGNFTEANDHLDRAQRLFTSLKDSGSVGQVSDTQARALLAQKQNFQAEKLAATAVRLHSKGDEQTLLAEALITHGTALARLGRNTEARSALDNAIGIATQAGDSNSSGLATLTLIEEMTPSLTLLERRNLYEKADGLLAEAQDPQTLSRLRACARSIIASEATLTDSYSAPDFIHGSRQTSLLLKDARQIATSRGAVLLTGETGTGKEVLAHLIHKWSGRAGRMLAINAAAIPDKLLESQIFGHKKGSFTDAIADYPGAVREAGGGTLFLDEIGQLSFASQGKLLRLIENGEIHSVGALAPEFVDVRIVAATNEDLQQLVDQKAFRADLFYRLNVFNLHIPPLRERCEDISAIAAAFIDQMLTKHRKSVTFTSEAIGAMQTLPLYGNTRELRSLIERTILTAPDHATITAEAIEIIALRKTEQAGFANPWENFSLKKEVLLFEERFIQLALKEADGHVTHASRLLGFKHHESLSQRLKTKNRILEAARRPAKKRKRSIIHV